MSHATGISPGTLTDWKKGRSHPKTDKLIQISNYLGVTPSYLMGLDVEDAKSPMGGLGAAIDFGNSIENMAQQDVEMFNMFHRLTPKNKEVVTKIVTTLLESQD